MMSDEDDSEVGKIVGGRRQLTSLCSRCSGDDDDGLCLDYGVYCGLFIMPCISGLLNTIVNQSAKAVSSLAYQIHDSLWSIL